MLRNQFARAGSMRLLTCVFAALLIYCLTVSLLPLFSTNTAVAQDDLSDILGDSGAAPPPAETPAEPAESTDDGAKTDAAGEGEAPTNNAPTSYLGWGIGALGFFFGPLFLAISITMVALVVMNILAARRENVMPSGLLQHFTELLDEKKFQDAYELAKADGSFLGLVLSAGLSRLSNGYEDAVKAMEDTGEDETMKLEHRLSYLALIGNISPMLGLFGTVYGMMETFSEIATRTTTPPANELAQGISTALVTTFVGLAIAIPSIAAFTLLRNKVARMVLEIGLISDSLIGRYKK